MRTAFAILVGSLGSALAVLACVGMYGCSLDKGTSSGPSPHPGDALTDGTHADASFDGDSRSDGTGGFDGPPPIEDTTFDDLGGPPPPGEHIEGTIGPDGGTLAGAAGSKLAGVQLVVPAGALTTSTLFAIDFVAVPPVPPTPAKAVTPYVRIGPEGVAFDPPARIVLPLTTVDGAPLFMMSRVGVSWSALLDPIGSSKSVSASIRRVAGAGGFSAPFTAIPKPSTFSPTTAAAGVIVFLDGTDFGLAPAFVDGVDGGLPFVSSISVGGVHAAPLGWSDTAISFRVPPATDGGVLTVEGPGGVGAAEAGLTIP